MTRETWDQDLLQALPSCQCPVGPVDNYEESVFRWYERY